MFSSTTPAQIRDSPLNQSSSKNHWSFSKAARFAGPQDQYLPIYEVANHLATIVTSQLCPIEGLGQAMVIDPNFLMQTLPQLILGNIKPFPISI